MEELLIPEEFAPALLKWYSENARTLPWRDDPEPYKVLGFRNHARSRPGWRL